MTDLIGLHARLRGEKARINVVWSEVRKEWNDAVASAFQVQHLQCLEQALGDYLRALEKVAEVLERAERDSGRYG